MADETISEKCETLYNKLNSFVTSVINRDVTPQINNLRNGKANTVHTHTSVNVTENRLLPNIESGNGASQSVVNGAVDDKVGSLSTSITNLVTVEQVGLVKTNANLTNNSSVDLSTTITIPFGYKVLDYYTRAYTGVTDVSRLELNGTTLSVRGWNHTGQTQSNVYIYVGVLYIRDI